MKLRADLEFRLAEIQDSSEIIYTDKNLLYKVMYHLIKNAWKFTERGYIEIGWFRNTSETTFYVKDSGIGIAHNQQEYIYDFFRQTDDSINRSYGGNGIGLSICKGFVKALGGEIWLKSELGRGATFYFSVPNFVGVPLMPKLPS